MTNRTTYSKKEIHSKLIDIANKYSEIDNEDYLKAGLFGYITESLSMIMRDSSIHKSMLYKESFLNTAVMPKSIYNWAKMFNININKATPAYADIELVINKNNLSTMVDMKTLDNYSGEFGFVDDKNVKAFVINKKDPIIADEYTFMLEHSIKIYRHSSGDNDFSAEYILTEKETTNYQKLKTNILTVYPAGNNIIIKARAYQYKINKISKQIPNNSILNTKNHVFNFEGQFSNITVSYERANLGEQNIECRYSNINNKEIGNFCYYNLNDPNEIQISFSNSEDAFMPKSNDILNVYIYTTEGSNVPSYFSGDGVLIQSDEDFKKYPIIVRFNPVDIIGGQDVPSLNKIRDTIINEISSRNVIITESDLNNYFTILTSLLESVNDGKVTFIKKRDDIIRRLFSAYLLIRDGMDDDGNPAESNFISRCVPTNTIDIDFPISKNASRPFGTIARHKSDIITEYVYAPTSNGLDDYYVIPFYMYISLNPIKKVKYLYNLVDTEVGSHFSSITISGNTSNGYYMIPTTTTVIRSLTGRFAASEYTVTFNYSTNFDAASYFSSKTENTLSIKKDGSIIADIKNNEWTVYSEQQEDNKSLFNTAITVKIPVAENEFDFASGSTKQINIKSGETSIGIPENVILELEASPIANGTTFKFKTVTDDNISLFQNLDNLLFSDIIINTETEDSNSTIKSITVKDVPVVHSSYFKNRSAENTDKFINQLFTYINILKENIDKLETNTFFDIKFYNTYGTAHIYDTLTTNTKVSFNIVLQNDYKDESLYSNIRSEIKSYIRRLVDESNKTNSLRISSIITLTDSTFNEYIDHIEFMGLNDSFNQYIKKLDIDESLQVPEWLNIPADKIDDYITFS